MSLDVQFSIVLQIDKLDLKDIKDVLCLSNNQHALYIRALTRNGKCVPIQKTVQGMHYLPL